MGRPKSALGGWTGGIGFLFALLLMGPYFPILQNLPLRLDHLFVPLSCLYLFVLRVFKREKMVFPKCLWFLFCFIILSLVSTYFSTQNEAYLFRWSSFLAGLEAHLRIFFILLLGSNLAKRHEIFLPELMRLLFWVTMALTFIGIFQVVQSWPWLFEKVRLYSIHWLSGRHDRASSIVDVCMGKRAVSTFYSPGNWSLFGAFFLPFLYSDTMERIFQKSRLLWVPKVWFILGWALSISKGFIGATLIFPFYLILTGGKRKVINFILVTTIAMALTVVVSPYARACYRSYLEQTSLIQYVNKFFGSRYGYIQEVKKDGEATETFQISGEGYLQDTYQPIKENSYFGLGYVANVKSGDSMIIHLLVRGGFLGVALYALFFLTLWFSVFRSPLRKDMYLKPIVLAWFGGALFFLLFTIAFPTFIQDRSGDLFFWWAALLAYPREKES